MLKNIYIQFGDNATNFLIKQYCKQNKEYLAEKNLHHIDLQDFFGTVKKYNWTDFYQDNVLRGRPYFKKNFSDEFSYDNMFLQLKEHIESNAIENIIIIMANEYGAVFLPRLNALCKFFSEAAVHFEIVTIDFFRQLSAYYNLPFLLARKKGFYTSLPNVYCRLSAVFPPLAQKISARLEKTFTIKPAQITFQNEAESFAYWLNKFHLEKKGEFPAQATFAPQVLAFITAIKEYYFSENLFDFTAEWDFLYAYSSAQPYSYCPKAIKRDYFEKVSEKETAVLKNDNEIDCSNASLRITLEDALFLADKISSCGRKELLRHVSIDDMEYMPATSKIAYLALMHAEKLVTLDEMQAFLKPKLGRVTLPNPAYKEEPILTVYTASYNNKEYLKQCIESILEQKTQYPFVHLIADDNSTDGSQELILEYAKKYPHIQAVLRKGNRLQINYHTIYNNISTKYAAVCDGDDFYKDSSKLEKQVAFLEANPRCGLSFHSAYVYNQEEGIVKSIYPQELQSTEKNTFYISSIIFNNPIQSSTVMYRWKFQNGLQHFMPLSCSPLDWASHIIHSYQNKIGFMKDAMSVYRRHSKAQYQSTEVNVAKFVIRNCYKELMFCKCLDILTDKKYHIFFIKKIFSILSEFYYSDAVAQVDEAVYQKMKNKIEKFFSDYVILFQEYKKYSEQGDKEKTIL